MKTLSALSKHDLFPLFLLAFAKLVLHLFAVTGYDYFRDEFYYIACSRHLDFGFVDHPPFADAVLFVVRNLLGESLLAIRIVPILASCSLVVIAGFIARELGGNRPDCRQASFAQFLAGLSVAFSPVLLGTSADFSMNVFDQLFWTLAIYFVVKFANTEQRKYLLLAGLAFGIGLQTKHLIAFLLIGMFVGIVLTQQRKHLRNKWLWISLATAFLIFVPNLVWQYVHGFPNLEFARNAALYKNTETKPLEFIAGLLLEGNPALAHLFVFSLWFFFIDAQGKSYRFLGIASVVIIALIIATNGKTYYAAPLLPLIFAAGSVQFSEFISRLRAETPIQKVNSSTRIHFGVQARINWYWLKPVTAVVSVIVALFVTPFALPLLPPESFVAYSGSLSETLGLKPPQNERHELGPLPQHYADMFGWRELAENVATVYNALPDSDKADCYIYTTNYGRAGSIDFFGGQYGLPKSICGHNNYWLWGTRGHTGRIGIIIGGRLEEHIDDFESVIEAGKTDHPYSMPYERNVSIFIGRGLKVPLQEAWNETRHYN